MTQMRTTHERTEEQIERNFSRLAFSVNRHLVDHMRRLSMTFDLDFECVYLWGITAQLNMAAGMLNTAPVMISGAPRTFPFSPTPAKLKDISAVAGRPLETVRRKLEILRAAGKLEKNAKGEWLIAHDGIDETTYEFTKETIRRYLATADELRRLLNFAPD